MKGAAVKVPLRLDALAVAGCHVQRSGIRWLCADGHLCRPGEVVAWCNIGVAPLPGHAGPLPFREEGRDFQVALAPRVGGRVVKEGAVSRGGFLDLQEHFHRWSPETVLGHLECDRAALRDGPDRAGVLKMLLLAGRRWAERAEVRWGPLTGWHDRCRAWWADGPGDFGTVLSLGICEQLGVIRGEQGAFFELFETVPGPAHVVFVPDEVLVPSAAVLLGQLRRTEDERRRLAEDLVRTFGAAVAAAGGDGSAAAAWVFGGCLLKAVLRSPLLERYDLLTQAGVARAGPPDAVILSLHSEHPYVLRHKRLGYALDCHPFRLREGARSCCAGWRTNSRACAGPPRTSAGITARCSPPSGSGPTRTSSSSTSCRERYRTTSSVTRRSRGRWPKRCPTSDPASET